MAGVSSRTLSRSRLAASASAARAAGALEDGMRTEETDAPAFLAEAEAPVVARHLADVEAVCERVRAADRRSVKRKAPGTRQHILPSTLSF